MALLGLFIGMSMCFHNIFLFYANFSVGPLSLNLGGNREIVADGTNTLTLTCTVSSSNPVSDIIWTQNGQPVTSIDRDSQPSGQYGGKMRIQDISITPTRDMDGYAVSCTAEHILLQANLSPSQQINLDLKCTFRPTL